MKIIFLGGVYLRLLIFYLGVYHYRDFKFFVQAYGASLGGRIIWGQSIQVFKGGLSKFCGRQSLKNLKVYGLLKQIISL